jgi:glycerophosphoryl diester phosphodiesterase
MQNLEWVTVIEGNVVKSSDEKFLITSFPVDVLEKPAEDGEEHVWEFMVWYWHQTGWDWSVTTATLEEAKEEAEQIAERNANWDLENQIGKTKLVWTWKKKDVCLVAYTGKELVFVNTSRTLDPHEKYVDYWAAWVEKEAFEPKHLGTFSELRKAVEICEAFVANA